MNDADDRDDDVQLTELDQELAIHDLEERNVACEWHGGCLCTSCSTGCTSSTCVVICW